MSASKDRPRWAGLTPDVRAKIEDLVGGRVVAAQNCEGGFSPGFASRLTLSGGGRVFVKAIDVLAWPDQATIYRDEVTVATQLPAWVPAPRLIGTRDDGLHVILAFEWADGAEPRQPWRPAELAQVAGAVSAFSLAATPSPVPLPRDRLRLGGWAEIAADEPGRSRLRLLDPWAADHLGELCDHEQSGLRAAAAGDTLVHFDALPQNILRMRTDGQVLLVDWPWARQGAAVIDLLMLLASAGGSDGINGIDLDALLAAQPVARETTTPAEVDGILAAITGFWLAGGLSTADPGLAPIPAAKLALGRGALRWLRRRLTSTGSSRPSC